MDNFFDFKLTGAIIPEHKSITYQSPADIFQLFANKPGAIFLDSSSPNIEFARYSFIALSPIVFIETKDLISNIFLYNKPLDRLVKSYDYKGCALGLLQSLLKVFAKFKCNKFLPPFQGGLCGYFGYELHNNIEGIFTPEYSLDTPDMAVGLYDIIIAFDNIAHKSWVISSGLPACSSDARVLKARGNIEEIISYINDKTRLLANNKIYKTQNSLNVSFRSNFSKEGYIDVVKRAQEMIKSGDLFEVNLSQQFEILGLTQDAYSIYKDLRQRNPAPFSAFINFSGISDITDIYLLSNSPERFLYLKDQHISTKPIKGTIGRSADNMIDKANAQSLLSSIKDRAENIMIVDLMRNDLSKVCVDSSIEVSKLCELESNASVHHLVSTIEGKLLDGLTALDLLAACFPGGSITGAPKIQAMQVIAKLEGVARGPYCGSIGYVGFNNIMDLSISIRTLVFAKSRDKVNKSEDKIGVIQAGGAVTLDSDPENEYYESLAKVSKMLNALGLSMNHLSILDKHKVVLS